MFEIDLGFVLFGVSFVSSCVGILTGVCIADRKHSRYMSSIYERDTILDECHENELRSKDETIHVLRGLLYALEDEVIADKNAKEMCDEIDRTVLSSLTHPVSYITGYNEQPGMPW